jgi:hypothetical protein
MFFWIIDIKYTEERPRFWVENNENKANCKSMGKQAYKILGNYEITGDLEEVVCEVEIKENKKYNIYIKLNDKAQYQYILFKNEQEGYFALRGNTKLIKELEATQIEYGLSESDKDFLATSKDLSNKFSALKDDAEYEDSLIKKNLDMEEKTHYVFTKDDILN